MKNTKLSNDYPRFCQICKRWFPTGKAMGGHMRSHLALAKLPSSRNRPTPTPPPPQPAQLRRPDPATLVPSSSSNNSSTSLSIINFVPPFSPDRGHSSDGYSPTGGHLTRRRSKRKRRQIQSTISSSSTEARSEEEEVAMCLLTLSRDPQLLDSVWKDKDKNKNQDAVAAADDDNNMEASQRKGKAPMADYHDDDESCCGQYRCETCNKGFRSYQALGGHRASHNKSSSAAKSLADDGGEDEEEEEEGGGGDCDDDDDDDEDEDYQEEEEEDQDLEVVAMNISNGVTGGGGGSGAGQAVRRQFPCSFCGKVFDSGQALGGHKKIHMSYHHHPPPPPPPRSTSTSTTATTVDELRAPQLVFPPGGRLMIDLNSSPLDDDESDEVYQF